MAPFIMNPFRFGGGGEVGSWKELDRTTLGSAGDSISVASLADKRYYMVLGNNIPSGSTWWDQRINNDSGSNYASRRSANGAADTTNVSQTEMITPLSFNTQGFSVGYMSNLSSKEKLWQDSAIWQSTAGAGTAPQRYEMVSKWANISNAINRFDRINGDSGSYNTGSEVVVLGYDPTDTHPVEDNFWQELASVTASGSSDTLSSSITAKKYLWIQGFTENTTGSMAPRVGNTTLDSGNNYATRLSSNGGAEDVTTLQDSITGLTNNTPIFWNMFIINNASNEKLMIWHVARQSTAGAGNFPKRIEGVTKWANTSNQIDIVGFVSTTGGSTINSNSIMKVWGSD